jgi:hypothetical protein
LSLRLAKELVGATVPDEVLHALRHASFDEALVATARMQIFTDRKLADAVPFKVSKLWQLTGLAAKVSEFLKSVCLPRTSIASMYAISPNAPGVYPFYLIRLKDVLARYGRTTLSLHRGDPRLSAVAQRKTSLHKWLAEEC